MIIVTIVCRTFGISDPQAYMIWEYNQYINNRIYYVNKQNENRDTKKH